MKLVNYIKISKSSAMGLLRTRVLDCFEVCVLELPQLFNTRLENGQFPTNWGIAKSHQSLR